MIMLLRQDISGLGKAGHFTKLWALDSQKPFFARGKRKSTYIVLRNFGRAVKTLPSDYFVKNRKKRV